MSDKAPSIAADDAALENYLGALLAPEADPDADMASEPAADESMESAVIPPSNDDESRVGKVPDGLDCLILGVGGITLAIRNSDVSAVKPWPIDYTVRDDSGGRIGGEWLHEGQRVLLVDTARVILPPASHASLTPLPGRAHEVVLLANSRWGLVSENAGQPHFIKEDCIHWRGETGRRPWLAGMVSEPRCALLDTGGLTRLLENDAMERGE